LLEASDRRRNAPLHRAQNDLATGSAGRRVQSFERQAPRKAASALPPLRVDIGAQHGVHSREMAFARGLEPVDDVGVEPQMHRGLSGRHNDARVLPEILAERLGFGRVVARFVLAARAPGLDLAKRISTARELSTAPPTPGGWSPRERLREGAI
jgi:hypothetical protein